MVTVTWFFFLETSVLSNKTCITLFSFVFNILLCVIVLFNFCFSLLVSFLLVCLLFNETFFFKIFLIGLYVSEIPFQSLLLKWPDISGFLYTEAYAKLLTSLRFLHSPGTLRKHDSQ